MLVVATDSLRLGDVVDIGHNQTRGTDRHDARERKVVCRATRILHLPEGTG